MTAAIGSGHQPEVLSLKRFDIDEIQHLARSLGHSEHGLDLERLLQRSAGNPFLLYQLLSSPGDDVPIAVRDVVRARLDTLGPESAALAEVISLDTSIPLAVVAAVSGMDPATFTSTIDRLESSGLFFLDDGECQFSHALVREAVFELVPSHRRAKLHGDLARALEVSHRTSPTAIADHWQRSGVPERSLESAARAAHYSFAIGAIAESVHWYETTLALWYEVTNPEALSGQTLGRLAIRASVAMQNCRKFGKARVMLRDILSRGASLPAATRAELWIQLSLVCWQDAGNEAVTLPEARAALDTAEKVLAEEMPGRDRNRLLSRFGVLALQCFGLEERAIEAAAALDELETSKEEDLELSLRSLRLLLQASAGSEQARRFLAEHPHKPWVDDGQYDSDVTGYWRAAMGLHDLNIELLPDAIAGLAARGKLPAVLSNEGRLARSLEATGRWQLALARWQSTKARVGHDAVIEWSPVTAGAWGPLLIRMGYTDEAIAFQADATLWVVPYGMQPHLWSEARTRVELARVSGSPHDAYEAVQETISLAREHFVPAFGEPVAYAIGLLADFSRPGSFDPEAFPGVSDWLNRLVNCRTNAPGKGNLWDLNVFIEQAQAEMERLIGRDNPVAWAALASRWQQLNRPYHFAYCRYREAFAYLVAPRATDRREARSCGRNALDSASAIAVELGAVHLQQGIAHLRATAGLRKMPDASPFSKPVKHEASVRLTSREFEVARLLGEGASNGQIAVRLGISVKTAAAHVSNIIRKFEASNRVDAAIRASRNRMDQS